MAVDLSTLLRDSDPTKEIRRYIEQLQDAVRDGSTRQTLLEEERDRYCGEATRLRTEMEAMRNEGRELRRDRDALADQIAQNSSALAEARASAESAERQRLDVVRQRDETIHLYKESSRQHEEAIKVKDEAVKQRDAFARQRDTLKKEREEVSSRVLQLESLLAEARKSTGEVNRDEIQRQVLSLRQARDAASAQNASMRQRINEFEDQIAEITYERDEALEAAKTAGAAESAALKAEIAELRKKNAAISTLLESVTTELQELRQVQQGRESEMEKMGRERELEMAEYGSKLDELRAAYENRLQVARQQYETAINERDSARNRTQDRESEMDGLRGQLSEMRAVADRLGAESAERARQIEGLQGEKLRADNAEKILWEARQSLADLQKQIEYAQQESDSVREQMNEQFEAMDEKIRVQAAEIGEYKRQMEMASIQALGHRELASEHEQHRLQMIELSAKLATAQAEIKELSATLAETRLRMKGTTRSATGEIGGAEPVDPALRTSLASLRRTFQDYLRQPSDFNLLNALQTYSQHLADRAREIGQMIVQRVSSVLAALTRELYECPEAATPPTMRTVGQSIEFIATLLKENELDQRVDLAKVKAFAVDDDTSVLDMICEALRAAGINTTTTDSAGAALAELSSTSYDLVVLDVNLPELDGLELCSHLREMPVNAATPVVFITGSASIENRVQFSLRGGSDLMIKPFNLLELALRSISLVVKARLNESKANA